jgi:hypothetical protein
MERNMLPKNYFVEQGKHRFLFVEDGGGYNIEHKVNTKNCTCSCGFSQPNCSLGNCCEHLKEAKLIDIYDPSGPVDLEDDMIEYLANEMLGSARSFAKSIEIIFHWPSKKSELDYLTYDTIDGIMLLIFQCDHCGYWRRDEDMSDESDDVCEECEEEKNDW